MGVEGFSMFFPEWHHFVDFIGFLWISFCFLHLGLRQCRPSLVPSSPVSLDVLKAGVPICILFRDPAVSRVLHVPEVKYKV